MINIVEDWGISDDPNPDQITASDNSQAFNSNIASGQTLFIFQGVLIPIRSN